ncbi:unnamed protein product [Microthlaspi erraticum]|uniref:Uncharacterized protein n=1 Tax=Microthlaspi erraticum TaxID=1685480 RepID=A0A6D2KSX6_9BRAS|nr:unnamed protein product [Microthlaspi erraticum]
MRRSYTSLPLPVSIRGSDGSIRGGLPTRGNVGRKVPGCSRASNSCSPPVIPLCSITERLQVPARQDQPTLHPEKQDGELWISIDNEVKYDIKRAFTNDFDGLWWNFGEVWQEPQDKWWSGFVMIGLGEEPAITYLVRKTHMKIDGSFVDKRAKKIIEEAESIVLSQQLSKLIMMSLSAKGPTHKHQLHHLCE